MSFAVTPFIAAVTRAKSSDLHDRPGDFVDHVGRTAWAMRIVDWKVATSSSTYRA
jgi:hypothetical protein